MNLFKLIAVLVALSVVLCEGVPQSKPSKVVVVTKAEASSAMFYCNLCGLIYPSAVECGNCHRKVWAVSTLSYRCAKDGIRSEKAGKCPKCGKRMRHGVETFVCGTCHTNSAQPGKCPVCKQQMVIRFVPDASKLTPPRSPAIWKISHG